MDKTPAQVRRHPGWQVEQKNVLPGTVEKPAEIAIEEHGTTR